MVPLGSLTPLLVVPALAWTLTKQFIMIEERQLVQQFGQLCLSYRAG